MFKRIVSVMYGCDHPFDSWFPEVPIVSGIHPGDVRSTDLVVLHGGGDISPSIYGKKVSRYTGANEALSYRDKVELTFLSAVVEANAAVFGICRGAQLLTAISGGYLIQHINNHAGSSGHDITTYNNEVFNVNSCHHQMCVPKGTAHELLGWAAKDTSDIFVDEATVYDGDEFKEVDVIPELIWYPKVRGLAVQWHPEWTQLGDYSLKYLLNQIKEKML